jgi:hypothetical protein
MERVEPPDEIITLPLDDLAGTNGMYNRDNRPFLLEYLYVHYQGEKYSGKFFLLFTPLLPTTWASLFHGLTSGDNGRMVGFTQALAEEGRGFVYEQGNWRTSLERER